MKGYTTSLVQGSYGGLSAMIPVYQLSRMVLDFDGDEVIMPIPVGVYEEVLD